MADVFKATPEQFNAHANQFKSYFTNMQNAYLKISNEVRTLGGNWTGEAAMTFQSQFDSMYKVLETTEKGMMQVVTEQIGRASCRERV